jgi:hypothetical protein
MKTRRCSWLRWMTESAMSMTLEQFLEALEKTPRDWQLNGGMIMRCPTKDGPQCPVSSLRNRQTYQWRLAAKEVRLSARTAQRIADAADYTTTPWKQLRAKLLKATGLA